MRQFIQAGTVSNFSPAGPLAPDGAVTSPCLGSLFHSTTTIGCMKTGLRSSAFPALHCQPSLLGPSTLMPRCHSGVLHRRTMTSNAPSSDDGRTSQCSAGCSSSEHHHHGTHSSSTRRSTTAHAAAGAATWDNSYDGADQSSTQQQQDEQQGCGCSSSTHSQSHSRSESHKHSHNGHHHHHHSGHDHHHHHHHYHTDAASSSNPVLSALSKTGLFSLAEHLERHTAYTITSVSCFVAALLMPYIAAQVALNSACNSLWSSTCTHQQLAMQCTPIFVQLDCVTCNCQQPGMQRTCLSCSQVAAECAAGMQQLSHIYAGRRMHTYQPRSTCHVVSNHPTV